MLLLMVICLVMITLMLSITALQMSRMLVRIDYSNDLKSRELKLKELELKKLGVDEQEIERTRW